MNKKNKRATLIASAVLGAGLAIGAATTGILIANQPLDITYYANNGTPAVSAQIKNGDNSKLPTPIRAGYNFAGWYLDIGLTQQVTSTTKLKQNSKLYAGWELANYEVAAAASTIDTQAETAGIKSIGNYAFAGCTGLTSITIPETVTSIGEGAFSGCSNLKTVYFNAVNATFAGYSSPFSHVGVNKIVFGENVEVVPAKCMLYGSTDTNNDLTEVQFLGNKVKTIGESAFMICSNLKSITLPEGLQTIDSGAFNSTGITSIKIPASVKTINTRGLDCGAKTVYIDGSLYNKATSKTALEYVYNSATDVYVKTEVEHATRNTYFLGRTNFYYKETINGYVHFTNDATQEKKLTITYYDEDGTTLLTRTAGLQYRGSFDNRWCSDKISSNGIYLFEGWYDELGSKANPSTATDLKESKNVYASYSTTKATLEECRWDAIKKISQMGYASNCFAVGDEKTVLINDPEKGLTYNLTMQIADFDHDTEDGENKVGITFVTKEILPVEYNRGMNSSATNDGGWHESEMRAYLNHDFYNLLPNELKEAITPVLKGTFNKTAAEVDAAYKDNLFLLSLGEINYGSGKHEEGYIKEGTPYALFSKWNETNNGNYSMRIKHYANSETAYRWWLRSPTNSASDFYSINTSGIVGVIKATGIYCISFAFCV